MRDNALQHLSVRVPASWIAALRSTLQEGETQSEMIRAAVADALAERLGFERALRERAARLEGE